MSDATNNRFYRQKPERDWMVVDEIRDGIVSRLREAVVTEFESETITTYRQTNLGDTAADLIVELGKKLAQADVDIAHWMVQALEIRQSRDAMEKQLVLAGLLSKPLPPKITGGE